MSSAIDLALGHEGRELEAEIPAARADVGDHGVGLEAGGRISATSLSVRSSAWREGRSSQSAPEWPMTCAISRPMYTLPMPSRAGGGGSVIGRGRRRGNSHGGEQQRREE